MILAETIATNVNWTLIFTIIMALATAGMWWDARRIREERPTQIEPNPLPVTKVFPSATLMDLKESQTHAHQRIDRLETRVGEIQEVIRKEIPEIERRLSIASEERVTKLHNRINEVLAAVSKIEGYCQSNHKGFR